jgi:choloylglycine hydrolase
MWVCQAASPCSTFYIPNGGRPVVGQNYDWGFGDGFAIVNQRGLSKTAAVLDVPASWTARYGSVTFNQYGREFPISGMNEAGLVVATMWLEATQYPRPDSRPAVNSLQWIQYQLDNAASVDEVIVSIERLRISPVDPAPLHYLVADRHGQCAVIEFIEGQAVWRVGAGLPACVLTNSTYDDCLAHLKQYAGFGGTGVVSPSQSSLGRFAWAADRLRRYEAQDPERAIEFAFRTLAEIAQDAGRAGTQWTVVYDIAARRIHFHTRGRAQVRTIELGELNFACGRPVTALNLATAAAGDATPAFVEYTREMNRKLIGDACRETPFLKCVPPVLVEMMAAYPETATCEDKLK